MSETVCYHCGLPVPSNTDFSARILGRLEPMCCPGCQAVAMAITQGGLDNFYQYRRGMLAKPGEPKRDGQLAMYDLQDVQEEFVQCDESGISHAQLAVKGITCSACAWLIENHLAKLSGMVGVNVNVSLHRCGINWDQEKIKLSDILYAFDEIGYKALPANDIQLEQSRQKENKQFLLRLGLAGLAMMQTGMVAIGLYAGDYSGIESRWQQLLQWVSFVLVTPVVFYSASPFFAAAWRALKLKHLVMDVPVSLAIFLAYSASTWATLIGEGEVYYDSVAMFTFFLLLGRYLEMRVRHKNVAANQSLNQLIPAVATRLSNEQEEVVAIKALSVDDIIRVSSGEVIPCDGEIVEGKSDIIEAVLTGEQKPVVKNFGQTVCAGTVNVSNPLVIKVTATGSKTRLGTILDLSQSVDAAKPTQQAMADQLAGWFVAAVLLISLVVGISWWIIEPAKALWVVLSVLVVTCPCALSLATPAALTVATGVLRRHGFLIRKPHVLEALAKVKHCVFDKTGTLTLGQTRVESVELLGNYDKTTAMEIVAGLEKGSTHPIAKAFQLNESSRVFTGLAYCVGEGISGQSEGQHYAIGKEQFVVDQCGLSDQEFTKTGTLLLANEAGLIAGFNLRDEIRDGADIVIKQLQSRAIECELLSGDHTKNAEILARELQIPTWQGDATPEQKLRRIKEIQKQGKKVMMVGDGINDVPVLNAADVSVAMNDASDLAQLHSDSVLVSGSLKVLILALDVAQACRRVIKQNLTWALSYNVIALPMACLGLIPPWLAAIGMSSSSLIVVLNAMRLHKVENIQSMRIR